MAIARETEIEDAECNARKGQEKHVRFKVTETEVEAVDKTPYGFYCT